MVVVANLFQTLGHVCLISVLLHLLNVTVLKVFVTSTKHKLVSG